MTATTPGARSSLAPSTPHAARNRALGVARLAVVWAAGAALAWYGRPTAIEWAAGLALAVAGETIRSWAAGYLVKSKELITAGPYAFVRNPLYLGRLLILSGVSIAAAMPWHLNLVFLAGGLVVFFGYYLPRKERVEPDRLRRLHGEAYDRYRASVPSIVPAFRRYDARNGTWGWSRYGRNREAFMVLSLAVFFTVLVVKSL